MTTSGTYNFNVNGGALVAGALRLLAAYGPQDTIPPEELLTGLEALNMVLKEMALDGLPLWCVQQLTIPTVGGQSSYNLSTASNSTLPLRVLDLFLTNSSGQDVSLPLLSRYDYDLLGSKLQSGVPNQAFYDPQLGAGALVVTPVPVDSTYSLQVVIQRQLQDVNLATETVDLPQEAQRLIKYALADELSLEYECKSDVRQEISMRMSSYRDRFFASQQEQVSIIFAPTIR